MSSKLRFKYIQGIRAAYLVERPVYLALQTALLHFTDSGRRLAYLACLQTWCAEKNVSDAVSGNLVYVFLEQSSREKVGSSPGLAAKIYDMKVQTCIL